MEDLVLYSVPVVGLIMGLVEVAKRSLHLDARWAPLLALALGVVFGVLGKLDQPDTFTWVQSVVLGVLTGLGASGAYSGARAVSGH
jgi:hypothetical protein